jgi:hypothetical protein
MRIVAYVFASIMVPNLFALITTYGLVGGWSGYIFVKIEIACMVSMLAGSFIMSRFWRETIKMIRDGFQ